MQKSKWIIIILIFIIITLAFRNTLLLWDSRGYYSSDNRNDESADHIIVILDKNSDLHDEILTGIDNVVQENNMVIELWSLDKYQLIKQLSIARLSKPDGIIVEPFLSEEFINEISQIEKLGIPVVTIGKTNIENNEIVHVGYNRYEFGKLIGEIINQSNIFINNIVVINSLNSIENEEGYKSHLSLGIKESIETKNMISINELYPANFSKKSQYSIDEIVKNYGSSCLLITTNEDDTSKYIKEILNQRIENRTHMIGFGYNEDVIAYVNRGVINSTISINGIQMGQEAIIAMKKNLDGQVISDTIHVEIKSVTFDNTEKAWWQFEDEIN